MDQEGYKKINDSTLHTNEQNNPDLFMEMKTSYTYDQCIQLLGGFGDY